MNMHAAEALGRALAGKTEEKLLLSFFVFYKTARIIDENNAVYANQSRTFFENLMAEREQSGDVTIKSVDGHYFVSERMVRFAAAAQSGADSVIAEWKSLGIGGVTFRATATIEEIRAFVKFMAGVKPNSTNIKGLSAELASRRWHGTSLLSLKEIDADRPAATEELRRQFRTAARSTFFQSMNVVEEAIVNTLHEKDVNIAKTKRVVHSLIDHIMRDESSMIELASIKSYDDYTYAHSTNVCVYALTLGVRLGLDRPRLSQLGFTALFHDIGKVKLPTDLIRKPDAYDENDWIQMQRHPLLGAKTIFRNMKLDIHTARAARGAFEHHINSDFTGYPTLHYHKRTPNLFSRIISVVDTFDALTSGRVYLKKAIGPDEVLKKMRYQMAIKFDKFLLEIFNDIIGIYPAGSLVLLTSEEIALILTNNDKDKARPYVKIVGTKTGLLEDPLWVDLSLPEHAHRKIVRLIDPTRYGLDIKSFVLKD
ncbi:MAG: HD domain-containing phosphohydrolase [Candidatus Zixiibacteriota bacterium]